MAIRKDFGFIGRLCLDFAQTGDMGWGSRYERLTVPSELQRWFLLSPLKPLQVNVAGRDLGRAKTLRGAIWRVAEAVLGHGAPAVKDVRTINAAARRPGLVRELAGDAKSMRWHHPTAAAALATIAQDAIMLFGNAAQRKRLRRCGNSRCRVVFYDDSRPGLRQWCASNRCGDRIRARRYRQRHRS